MHIALTGAGGRIGRRVAALAADRGHTTTCIDRPGVALPEAPRRCRSVSCDTTSYDDFEAAVRGSDALVHLAAYPSPRGRVPHEVHNNNVVSSYNALSIAAALGIDRVCQASSINAIGGAYSRSPRYDYFPIDEQHPTYNEDPYSLSKWICELQADSMARLREAMTICSLRFHWVIDSLEAARDIRPAESTMEQKQLWGYTTFDAAARACLASLTADFTGHEAFYIVAPRTVSDRDSLDLAKEFYPDTPIAGDLSGTRSFFDSSKAERLLGWRHDSRY